MTARTLGGVVIMVSITRKQWMNICTGLLGLRSGADGTDLKGASYAMDCGANALSPPPSDWDTLLTGTITYMMGFENYKKRSLMVVRKSTGSGEKYSGTFPKCSAYPTECLTFVQFGDHSVDDLAKWVIAAIPG